jgi:hypothetical protein
MKKHKHRDPQVINRDPIPEMAREVEPIHTQPIPPPLPHALKIDVPSVKCKRCNGTAFNNCNATRPSKAVDKMVRRKQCMRCGQWHVMHSEPTEIERARFW